MASSGGFLSFPIYPTWRLTATTRPAMSSVLSNSPAAVRSTPRQSRDNSFRAKYRLRRSTLRSDRLGQRLARARAARASRWASPASLLPVLAVENLYRVEPFWGNNTEIEPPGTVFAAARSRERLIPLLVNVVLSGPCGPLSQAEIVGRDAEG